MPSRKTYDIAGLIPGIRLDGELVGRYWSNIDDLGESSRQASGFVAACPDVGTMVCLSCDLGLDRYFDVCDFNCRTCAGKHECPCSRIGYEGRQEAPPPVSPPWKGGGEVSDG